MVLITLRAMLPFFFLGFIPSAVKDSSILRISLVLMMQLLTLSQPWFAHSRISAMLVHCRADIYGTDFSTKRISFIVSLMEVAALWASVQGLLDEVDTNIESVPAVEVCIGLIYESC